VGTPAGWVLEVGRGGKGAVVAEGKQGKQEGAQCPGRQRNALNREKRDGKEKRGPAGKGQFLTAQGQGQKLSRTGLKDHAPLCLTLQARPKGKKGADRGIAEEPGGRLKKTKWGRLPGQLASTLSVRTSIRNCERRRQQQRREENKITTVKRSGVHPSAARGPLSKFPILTHHGARVYPPCLKSLLKKSR